MPDPFTQTVDPFMSGGSAPGLKFPEVGDIRSIVVRQSTERVDTEPDGTPRLWPSGEPKNVYIFTGEDEHGDPASLWVRGNLVTVIREAVVKAGLKTVVDTRITVKRLADGTPPSKGMNAPKLYAAKVEAVAPAVVTEAFGDGTPIPDYEAEEVF